MKLKHIINFLEARAPLALQESYDNSGLLLGHVEMEIRGAIICLDSTEEVIDEAIATDCNLVIAHHPIIFSGLKKISGHTYIERAVIKAIKNDVAIYAIHTNLDNVQDGVNQIMAEKIGLKNLTILAPKSGTLSKIAVMVPVAFADKLRTAMFAAGAGSIGNYDECSFNLEGMGTFRGDADSQPFVGAPGKSHQEKEMRVEVIVENWKIASVISAIISSHPYQEVAYDVYPLANSQRNVGSGMVGELENDMPTRDFLLHLKKTIKTSCVRHTAICKQHVKRIAVCGGSGSFLLTQAIAAGADVLVTADFKYHQFFDADDRIVIADIGHYESEQFTMELLRLWLDVNFPTFAPRLTTVVTNPVLYL
ncbi:MAG: Nif3-like dinuclear metal center hexameric protein [Flavobacteriales bacterium]|nr:Nif3-like dinuclear metal center hexameric protein [Flavobacteriales bacterium]